MKKLLKILICISLIFVTIGCTAKEANKVEDTDIPKYTENTEGTDITKEHVKIEGTPILKEHGNEVLTIQSGNKACTLVSLRLYDNGIYELFTEYKAYKGAAGPLKLEYTKSKKGTYSTNIDKILEESVDANGKTYNMDNLPEYDLYTSDFHHYTVEKGKTNKALNAFLKKIKVDLNACASPDYDW